MSHLAPHTPVVGTESFRLQESKVMFLFRGKEKDPRQPRCKGYSNTWPAGEWVKWREGTRGCWESWESPPRDSLRNVRTRLASSSLSVRTAQAQCQPLKSGSEPSAAYASISGRTEQLANSVPFITGRFPRGSQEPKQKAATVLALVGIPHS